MKKNNKGFTLVELLGVIVILSILITIAGIAISKYIKNSQNKTYLSFEKNLKSAANNYMIDCIESNEEDCTIPEYGGSIALTYNELVNKGYSKIIKDPQSNGYCDESYVVVRNQNLSGVKLDYEVCLLCDKYKTNGGCTFDTTEKYAIKYDSNGGNGKMNSTICNKGEECKASINEFEFEGRHFVEWNTKRDGTGQSYNENDTVSGKMVLYAIWEKVTIDEEYTYTGEVKEFEAPFNGKYQLEVYGAEGGYRGYSKYSGKGGYAIGTVYLEKGTKLFIYVGGNGTTNKGYNGGGKATCGSVYGGGATDIRIGDDDLYARVIVAGGGGSVGAPDKKGGDGGGLEGGTTTEEYVSSYCSDTICGQGGTQFDAGAGVNNSWYNTEGSFGKGGDGRDGNVSGCSGAGGGGWYGGSGSLSDALGGDDDRGGGGGSGYIFTSSSYVPTGYLLDDKYQLTDASMSSGVQSGDGKARIKLIEVIE